MIGVDAVAVGHVEVVADLDPIHQDVVAPQHVEAPERAMAERDAAHFQAPYGGEQEDSRAERTELPDLAFFIETRHEFHGPAVDIAGSRDLDVVRAVGGDDAFHAFHVRHVMLPVGAGQKLGVVRQVKVDPALQDQRSHHVLLAAAHQNLTAAGRGGGVDGFLDGGGVQRLAVAHGSVVAGVVSLLGAQRQQGSHSRRRAKERPAAVPAGNHWHRVISLPAMQAKP